jgi:hypothetical protein
VAGFAKGLKIVRVIEQRLIALVRLDVVRDGRSHDVLMIEAETA